MLRRWSRASMFPAAHPAIPFLLLLAIADDALGLIILAVFYPSGPLSLPALVGFMAAAVVVALWLRRRRTSSVWPYVIGPGALSWAALYLGGFHPALALVPIVSFMPHSSRDLGLFDPREDYRPDTLNRFEHWWSTPVQFVLLLFGFANAGVPFEQIGAGTYYVLAGLLLGKAITRRTPSLPASNICSHSSGSTEATSRFSSSARTRRMR